jgi:hypothetical protein
MLVSGYKNADQNQDMKIAIRSFGNASKFRYLGTTVTNQNFIHEEINRRMNSRNTCYNSVQNLRSSRLLSKNLEYIRL